MFRKIVSNIPFSPFLAHTLGFYINRLRKEEFSRRIGLICAALLVMVQSMTLLSPPRPTLAASNNDIIYGGAGKSAQGIIKTYASGKDTLGRTDIKKIFNAYGIDASNIQKYRMERIYSSTKNNYWSLGRSPRGYGGEVPVQIPKGPKLYSRTLHGWQANTWWNAMRIETKQGVRWILIECGNIVVQKNSTTLPPDVVVTKSVNKEKAFSGEKLKFTIKVQNKGKGLAKNVLIYDNSPVGIDLLNEGLGKDPIVSARRWQTSKRFNIAPGQTYTYTIYARVTAKGAKLVTNKACADIFDSNIYNNCSTRTVYIPPPCPYNSSISTESAQCSATPKMRVKKTASQKKVLVGEDFVYRIEVQNIGNIDLPKVIVRDDAPQGIEFLGVKSPGDNEFKSTQNKSVFISSQFSLKQGASVTFEIKARASVHAQEKSENKACALSTGTNTAAGACDETEITIVATCPTNPQLDKDDSRCSPGCPIPNKSNLPADHPDCQPCDESREQTETTSCLELNKAARNITQNIKNASNTKAQPGDVIEYTLSVKNIGETIRKGFVIEENLDDVLEYADLIDANGAQFQTNPVRLLSWDPVDIKPGETISRTLLIKIKSPLPATPASTSDPLSYDQKIVNTYGNTVEISLPQTTTKTVEKTVKMLPSTGSGLGTALTTFVVMAAIYFYYRSRLLIKESLIIRSDYTAAGEYR